MDRVDVVEAVHGEEVAVEGVEDAEDVEMGVGGAVESPRVARAWRHWLERQRSQWAPPWVRPVEAFPCG
jgi:hypothetical protein